VSSLVWSAFGVAQVITSIAGTGTDLILPPSGAPAVNLPLRDPVSVAIDSTGNLYIADFTSCVVARVSPDGILTIVAGNGRCGFSADGISATSASLNHPSHVAVDNSGNLYINDNGRILKVSNGTITTLSSCLTVASCTSFPGGNVVADAAGNFYGSSGNTVRKLSNGTITIVAGTGTTGFSGDGGPATSAQLSAVGSLAVDLAGNLYLYDVGNFRVRKVSNGIITTVAGNGVPGFSGDGGPAIEASLSRFMYGGGLSVDSAGNLYIADVGNYRIRKVSSGMPTVWPWIPLEICTSPTATGFARSRAASSTPLRGAAGSMETAPSRPTLCSRVPLELPWIGQATSISPTRRFSASERYPGEPSRLSPAMEISGIPVMAVRPSMRHSTIRLI